MNLQHVKNKCEKKDGSLYGNNEFKNSLSLLYHENSKLTRHSLRVQGEKINSFVTPYVVQRAIQPYKHYPNYEKIDLNPYISNTPNIDFFKLLSERRSTRIFDKNFKISLNEISNILYNSYGVSKKVKIDNQPFEGSMGYRNVPSAGGLYPLEVYVVLFNSHIKNGLYHYRPDENSLEKLKVGDYKEYISSIIKAEPHIEIKSSSAVILITSIVERQFIKYGERAYRLMLQEVGFVSQTISLIIEAYKLGSCWVGGYLDDKINNFIGIDGSYETINNVIVIGKKVKNK